MRDLLISPLENRYPPVSLEAPPAFDAIVVLGGGTRRQSPDQGGRSALAPESLARLLQGLALHRRTGALLIASGGVVWEGSGAEPEADVARRALLVMGVAENAVLREAGSRTTWENARRISEMLPPGKVIALVTSASHMPRAMLAFRRAGIACVPAPTDYRATRGRRIAADFIPSFDALSESFRALREYAGLVLYAVRR
ncbi:MAG: YdcF family protein [Spirochaetes bacterium]|nr:YdcF family protein [Spirochaetota bacterium]